MDLSLIETIDIDFRDKIPEQYLQSLICNFRVSDPNSKNKWPMSTKHHDVIPHKNIVIRDNYKRNRIFKIRGGKTIRLDMRGLTHYALNPGRERFFGRNNNPLADIIGGGCTNATSRIDSISEKI